MLLLENLFVFTMPNIGYSSKTKKKEYQEENTRVLCMTPALCALGTGNISMIIWANLIGATVAGVYACVNMNEKKLPTPMVKLSYVVSAMNYWPSYLGNTI